jgi:hypothetical protein
MPDFKIARSISQFLMPKGVKVFITSTCKDLKQDWLQNSPLIDETIFFSLRGAGLVQRSGQEAIMRNQLYADFFREHIKR